MSKRCPICGTELNLDRSLMGWTLMEETRECPEGHYIDEFITGNIRTTIGDDCFTLHWTADEEERNAYELAVKMAIERVKANTNST